MTTRALIMAPHFAPGYRAGGTLRSLVSIVDSAPSGVEVMVITSDRDLDDPAPYEIASNRPVARGRHSVLYVRANRCIGILRWLRVARKFRAEVLYLNSLWNPWYSLAPLIFTLLGLIRPETLLVAPRGQLGTAALSVSSAQKRMAMRLWKLAVSKLPVVWHATDEAEAQLIKKRLPGNRPTILSMDPVALPPEAAETTAGPPSPLRIAFVGRIAPVKNVATMVAGVCDSGVDFHLTVVGPQEDSEHVAKTKIAAAACPSRVTFIDALPHEEMLRLLSSSHVMFFPTLGENFGHVVAEALSRSCPVVCGPVTPFTDIIRGGGGRVIEHRSQDAWRREAQSWAAMSTDELLSKHRDAGNSYEHWVATRDTRHVLSSLAD